MQDKRSEAQRRWDMNDALANCKIEGFVPDAEHLEQSERIIRGEITTEQAIEEIKAKYQRGGAQRTPSDAT
jgi:hypothetical protein